MTNDRARRGIVLLTALVVLGVVGTMLVAGFYAARAEQQYGQVALRADQLDAEADGALVGLLVAWDSSARFRQAVGTTDGVIIQPSNAATTADAWITRLSERSYWLSVRYADRIDSALVVRGAALVEVRAPEFVVAGDTAADPAAPGGVPMHDFAVAASRTIFAGYSGPAPVGNLVFAEGSITLTGGAGSGVLVVDGSVTLAGPLSFRGVIFAAQGFKVTTDGVWVDGLMLSGAKDSGKPLHSIALLYDSLLVAGAEWHAGAVRFVTSRGREQLP